MPDAELRQPASPPLRIHHFFLVMTAWQPSPVGGTQLHVRAAREAGRLWLGVMTVGFPTRASLPATSMAHE
jgi:hypothetical protein